MRDIRKLSIGLVLALYVSFGHKSFVKGPVVLFTQEMTDVRLDGFLTLIVMTYGRLGDLVVLLRYLNQLQGSTRDFDAQLETPSLLLQYLLQQNRSPTGDDRPVSDERELKSCGGMLSITNLALIMRIDLLALIFGLRELVKVTYGPALTHVFPDVQVKAYRHSMVLYENLVSVVDCSVLNWVEPQELSRLLSDDRLFYDSISMIDMEG